MNRSYSSNSSRRGRGIAVAFFLEDRSDIWQREPDNMQICYHRLKWVKLLLSGSCDQNQDPNSINMRSANWEGEGNFSAPLSLPRIILGIEIEDGWKGEANTILR